MDKNLLKAFALSAAILFGWQLFVTWYYPPQPAQPAVVEQAEATPPVVEPPPAQAQAPAPAKASGKASGKTSGKAPATTPAAPAVLPVEAVPPREVTVVTSLWSAKFSNRGGVATSWKLLRDLNGQRILATDNSDLELISEIGVQQIGAPLRLATPGDDDLAKRLNEATAQVSAKFADGVDVSLDTPIEVADGQTLDLTFVTTDVASNQVVTKSLSLTGGQFTGSVSVASTVPNRTFSIVIGPRIGDQSVKTEGSYSNAPPQAIVTNDAGKAQYFAGGSVKDGLQIVEGIPRWGGVADNYFAMTVATTDPQREQSVVTNAKLKFNEADAKEHDFVSVSVPVASAKPMALFVGPKDPAVMADAGAKSGEIIGVPVDYSTLINYGFFHYLVQPLIPAINWALTTTNRITGNYGWSIIIVTTLFNLMFFPLRYKSSVSMKRAAKLQPKMKEVQAKLKKYKPTDPQFKELQSEQMALMKEGNPLGGCLPMLVQFPFFWAFFIYFTTTFVVRKQPWIFWVQDLTAPDHYYILPVAMCAAQIGSMLITPMPNSDDPAMKMQRRLMTWVMPIAFTYFFLVAAPSGLVLYWMTLNLVGIGVQYVINKMMPPELQQNAAAVVENGKKPKKGPPTAELVGSEK